MIKRYQRSTQLFLALALIVGSVPVAALADNLSKGKSLQLRTMAVLSPIGRLYSLGGLSVNGRSVYGEQVIWAGDLLQSTGELQTRVLLGSMGQIVLAQRATLRLATIGAADSTTNHKVLIASLLGGSIIVRLDSDVSAYIEACDSAFTASNGATFRAEIRANHAVASVMKGKLTQELITRRTYHVRLVKPVLSANQDMEVKKEQTATNEYQVNKSEIREKKRPSDLRVSFRRQPDSAEVQATVETPAPGKRVRFTLDQNIGELTPAITTTDSQGKARVTFKARVIGEANLTTTVIDLEHTDDVTEEVTPQVLHIRVVRAGFWTRGKLLIAAAVVAGAVCIFACRSKAGPLRQEPPPIIP